MRRRDGCRLAAAGDRAALRLLTIDEGCRVAAAARRSARGLTGPGAGRDRPRRRRPAAAAARSCATTRAAASEARAAGRPLGEDRQLQVALYMLAVRELLGPSTGRRALPAARRRRPAGTRLFLEDAPVGARVFASDARAERGARRGARRTRRRGRWRSRRGCGRASSTPCPETCSRDGCRYPGICRSQMPGGTACPRVVSVDTIATTAAPPERAAHAIERRGAICCSTPAPAAARRRCSSSASCGPCSRTGSTWPRS